MLDLFAEMFLIISSTFQRFAIIAKISIQFSAFDRSDEILAQNVLILGKVASLESWQGSILPTVWRKAQMHWHTAFGTKR